MTRGLPRWTSILGAVVCLFSGCDDEGPVGGEAAAISGRWVYHAAELKGARVTCATSDVILTLHPFGSLRVDAGFSGTGFAFRMECTDGERSATLLFSDGTTVVNGEIDGGSVAFDFSAPDFLHTGTIAGGAMQGTVATRLDLSRTPLAGSGVVNLVGTWVAKRD